MLHPSIFVVPKAGMVIKDSEQGQNYHTYTLGTTKIELCLKLAQTCKEFYCIYPHPTSPG